jgi:hypothetical protein
MTEKATVSEVCVAPIELLTLKHGQHAPGTGDYCAVEAAVCRFTKGEKHSDKPEDCNGSEGLGRMMIRLNDRWDDEQRQKLKPFVDRLPNSKGTPAQERQRAFMAADWATRVCLPMLCEIRPELADWAPKLRALGEVKDKASAKRARKLAREVMAADDFAADAADFAASAAAYAAAYAATAADAADFAASAAAYAAYAATAAAYAFADARGIRDAINASCLDLLDRMFRVTE